MDLLYEHELLYHYMYKTIFFDRFVKKLHLIIKKNALTFLLLLMFILFDKKMNGGINYKGEYIKNMEYVELYKKLHSIY